jgi:L-threonylcarbamoyladenylate synthase
MSNTVSIQMLNVAAKILQKGGVIAYPTEGVYGFGCNPLNPSAVKRLLKIKHRKAQKGFILVAESWPQLTRYIAPIPEDCLERVLATWPGPVTWVFPAAKSTPPWLKANNDSLAVRVSDHPLIQQLCRVFKGPILSTSANIQGGPPTRTYEETCQQFKEQLDMIVPGNIGTLNKPTPIKDALTGKVLRD